MKIGENDSIHELAKILQACSKFHFILFFYFDNLHLQIIESFSPKESVENSSAQWDIFFHKHLIKNKYIHKICYFLSYNEMFTVHIYNCFVQVSHSLGRNWEPLKDYDLPPAVIDPLADAETGYLHILHQDQAW